MYGDLSMLDNEFVTISKKDYDELVYSSRKLALLEEGGVDNWEWYSESLQELYEDE